MNQPAAALEPKPRRSAWRWGTALAAGLLAVALVYLFTLERRERRRAEFERQASVPAVFVGYHWSPPLETWLDDQEAETAWFDRRLGEAHVDLNTGDFPGFLHSPEQLHQVLDSLRLMGPVGTLMLDGPLVDDAALEHLPPGLTCKTVDLQNSRVTEQGVRNICRQQRPLYVSLRGDNLTEESIQRLRKEFPEITLDFTPRPGMIPGE